MFAQPLLEDYADVAELVAFCDTNTHRLDLAAQLLPRFIPTYTQFERLLAAAQPAVVIVCSVDATHHEYIIAALEAGCDVITEKPMTTTAENVRAILEAEQRTGRSVRVSFNARYGAPTEAIYRLLREGAIGQIISADYAEFLDTSHGADYFRRWHRRKENSAGLLVHKASHHFDQLNWWIGAEPETVHALGDLRFYGPTRDQRGERCLTCAHTQSCEFYLDLAADEKLNALYLQGESLDGYYRDRCVFGDDIDIEDTITASIRYANGVLVTYSLNAYLPIEGQRIGFNGSEGRLEVDLVDRRHGPNAKGRVGIYPLDVAPAIHVYPRLGQPYEVPVEERSGGHGGADQRIREHLFRPGVPDPLNQKAGAWAGAMSVLIGVAANQSIATGQPVTVPSLLSG